MHRVGGTHGYTIVETMIFLAISASLFVSAFLLINGQQQKTQFATTVRDFSSEINSVMGNVASGSYNNSGQVTCVANAGLITRPINNTGANQQGTNGDCEFIGQVLVSPQTGTTDFQIIGLVGLRTAGSPPQDVTKLSDADPTLFVQASQTYSLAGADLVSIKVNGVYLGPAPPPVQAAVAFITTFPKSGANGSLANGSGHTDVYALPSNDLTPITGLEQNIKNAPPGSANPSTIEFCLTNGAQRAKITLSGGTTTTLIGDSSTCT